VRVAIAGKGGAGKTTISATLCRLMARAGTPVVAVDADANPNLAAALGVTPESARAARPLSPSLVSRKLNGPRLTAPVDVVLEEYAVAAPDGVRLVAMGAPAHADEGCLCSAHATVSALLADLGDGDGRLTVIDMEASPEHLSRGTVRHVDVLCLVAEPYYRSLETVRRLGALAAELEIPRLVMVANKIRSAPDAEAVREFAGRHGLELVGEVPWGEEVVNADRDRIPLVQIDPPAPSVEAVRRLGEQLLAPVPR